MYTLLLVKWEVPHLRRSELGRAHTQASRPGLVSAAPPGLDWRDGAEGDATNLRYIPESACAGSSRDDGGEKEGELTQRRGMCDEDANQEIHPPKPRMVRRRRSAWECD